MLNMMCRPVAPHPASRHIVVSKAASPHYLCPCPVVLRILQHIKDTVLHSPHQCLSNIVRYRHIAIDIEISLHSVHHDIRHTSCRLIGRQRERSLRIHYSKLRTTYIVRISQLDVTILISDDTRLAHLTSCSRNRQHAAHRHTSLSLSLAHVEVPHLAVIRHTITDSL